MIKKSLKRVAVTGGSGQIAYSLLFQIAAGRLLGEDQPVALHILELPQTLDALKGVVMELEDCAFPLLKEIRIGSDPRAVFADVNYALLIGAKPRGPGMERKDLLQENAQIFLTQGRALNEVASSDVVIFVVGNPCNTNCLIALKAAPDIPKHRFYAMMRLDQNRAASLLAAKAGVAITDVAKVCIWGNHSATQVPDFLHAEIQGKPALDIIKDRAWCADVFIPAVQKRGAAVIAARGKSSAASAAHAVIESIRSLEKPTPPGDWFSIGSFSEGNPYGIDENLIFSFPSRFASAGRIEIVQGLQWDPFLEEKIRATEKELLEERALISQYLK